MAARPKLSRFEWACAALIALGIATRGHIFVARRINWDAGWYLSMGKSLVQYGEFISPWYADAPYTRHFPPGYPLLDAVGYAVGGPSFVVAGTIAILIVCFLAAVTFFTTKDLYGRSRAFATTAIVITAPLLTDLDIELLSESLVVAFFALTVWAILRSLDSPRYILYAGLFAGLGYLTKASMGPFFLLAGAGGFAWRFYYARWAVFRDRYYMGAALIFALFVVPWAARNVIRHGWPNWETQPHATEAVSFFFAQAAWPRVLGLEFLWAMVVMAGLGMAFLPEILRTFKRIKEERTSALWLGVLTPTMIGIIFAAAFASFEYRPLVSETMIRYLITPLVPLLWLGVRDLDFGEDAPTTRPTQGAHIVRSRAIWLTAGTLVMGFFLFANPTWPVFSARRVITFTLGIVIGMFCLLVARSYAWRPERRQGGAAVSWRAVRARVEGAPSVAFAIFAFVFMLAVTLGVALGFLAFLTPLAASAAAYTPRARVIVLCLCAALVPFAALDVPTALVQAGTDLSELAGEGEAVTAPHNSQQFVYPFLRDDLRMVERSEPHDWLIESGVADPGPGYVLEREYFDVLTPRLGSRVGQWVWGGLFEDTPPREPGVNAQLYRAIPLAG